MSRDLLVPDLRQCSVYDLSPLETWIVIVGMVVVVTVGILLAAFAIFWVIRMTQWMLSGRKRSEENYARAQQLYVRVGELEEECEELKAKISKHEAEPLGPDVVVT